MATDTNTITGTIIHIGPVQQPTAAFRKRDVVLRTTGNYPQEVKCQVSQDRCETLNDFRVGDVVACAFDLRGRQYTNKQGQTDWFTNVEVWRIQRIDAAHALRHAPFDDVPNANATPQPVPPTPPQQLSALDDVPF